MNILFLQGPNLNLLGLKSSQIQEKITLDKLNKHIKKTSRAFNSNLKILQTHKNFKALNFLQRNRSWADGIIIIPTSWGKYNFNILETIKLLNLKTAIVYFDKKYSFGTSIKDTIMIGNNIKSFIGEPLKVCSDSIVYLHS